MPKKPKRSRALKKPSLLDGIASLWEWRLTRMAAFISLVSGSIGVVLVGAWNFGTYTELRPAILKEMIAVTAQQKLELNDFSSKTTKELDDLRKMATDATLLAIQAKFNVLYDKYLKCDCLTFEEKQEMCRLAAQLDYKGIC